MPRGEQFLHKKFPELHTTDPVEREKKNVKRKDEKVLQKPAEKIEAWLKVLEKTHGHYEDPRVLERIKKSYHKDYVIKSENVPESYFKNQQRLAREQGHGDIELTDEARGQLTEVIIADQESTLDNWIDYLASPDATFPTWAKYWVFKNMVRLSNYDKEKKAFTKRRKDTVAPFPDLNREALAYVIDAIVKKTNKEDIPEQADNAEFQKLLQGESFAKLYAYAIEKVTPDDESEFSKTKGIWKKHRQFSDHMPLVESLQGHGTGWCTAGESTAETQLKAGDFHVYYSFDKSGNPTIPRVAIRMERDNIAEIRGVVHEQNLDPFIGDVVKKKLGEFPDGKKFEKKTNDMKKLTMLDKKHKAGEEFTIDDLRFLYEIDSEIQDFGFMDDPRIEEIKENRDKRKDLLKIFNIAPEQIAMNLDELNDRTLVYGDSIMSWSENLVKELPANLTHICGGLWLENSSIKELPPGLTHISGNLNLDHTQIKELPASLIHIGGDLILQHSQVEHEPDNIRDIVKGRYWRRLRR